MSFSSTEFAADPVTPARALFGLAPFETPEGTTTEHRPFGLSLARESTSVPVDMSDVAYDPQVQATNAAGRSSQTINTPYQTVYDHTRSNDNKPDTRTD